MKGFKGFNSDLSCRGFKYEIGKTYEMDTTIPIELCQKGFHYCLTLSQCFAFYDFGKSRFCEIEAVEDGQIIESPEKCCCSIIRIVRELSPKEINRVRYGNGDGDGYGYGYGNGYGYGYGDGYGYGNGDGYGYGDSYGYGNGYGYGDGDGYGNGDGYGYGDSYGYGKNIQKILTFTED